MSYYSGFHEYVSVAEKKEKAKAAVEKLKKKNSDISPVIIEGRKLAVTWWGNSWNNNLVSYSDYSNRIGRGRSYVRNGAVLDLKISEGKVDALVQGSGSRPYKVSINIKPIQKNIWDKIKKECAGKIESLQEIVEGKFPKALQSLFTTKGEGLFPSSKEISFSCSCPDGAYMCKHVAAVFFGVGARLDNDPKLFFVLRNIKVEELISETIVKKSETLL
ncbi:MAG: SWIM zinc finger family protein, partial [Bacillota bacterium]|nr:SWIM zinc finger family protein [Bacillota bacterium]